MSKDKHKIKNFAPTSWAIDNKNQYLCPCLPDINPGVDELLFHT